MGCPRRAQTHTPPGDAQPSPPRQCMGGPQVQTHTPGSCGGRRHTPPPGGLMHRLGSRRQRWPALPPPEPVDSGVPPKNDCLTGEPQPMVLLGSGLGFLPPSPATNHWAPSRRLTKDFRSPLQETLKKHAYKQVPNGVTHSYKHSYKRYVLMKAVIIIYKFSFKSDSVQISISPTPSRLDSILRIGLGIA
jgi:hypothetical protein